MAQTQEMQVSEKKEQFYATGRRKSSVARVFIKPGKGDFVVKIQKSKS